jgi:Bax protein
MLMAKRETGEAREESVSISPRAVALLGMLILIVIPCLLFALASGPRIQPPSLALNYLEVPQAIRLATDHTQTAFQAESASPAITLATGMDASSVLDFFKQRDYRLADVRSGHSLVPRIIVTDIPTGMADLDDRDDRKALFVKTLLPLILLANEAISHDRARLLQLREAHAAGRGLSHSDTAWLAMLSKRYGVEEKGDFLFQALVLRVDAAPVSLVLAQAAEESGWGTSRFAQSGNALFGQMTFDERQTGIVPRNRKPGESHRFRSFTDPKASVESYIHNLNTNKAYLPFRKLRAAQRGKDKPLDGLYLAAGLASYSERGDDYVQSIKALIRHNDLQDFDQAALAPPPAGTDSVLIGSGVSHARRSAAPKRNVAPQEPSREQGVVESRIGKKASVPGCATPVLVDATLSPAASFSLIMSERSSQRDETMLDDAALDALFRQARTHNGWRSRPVEAATLRQLYELTKWGPTSANCSPLRIAFAQSEQAKRRLLPCLSEGNAAKTMAAPVTAILAYDLRFADHLPRLFPHTDARPWFADPAVAEMTAFRNGSLQGGYFIMAARALGLDCGPMSGFDHDAVKTAFFPDDPYKVNFLCNVGYGDPDALYPRSPRFDFDDVVQII